VLATLSRIWGVGRCIGVEIDLRARNAMRTLVGEQHSARAREEGVHLLSGWTAVFVGRRRWLLGGGHRRTLLQVRPLSVRNLRQGRLRGFLYKILCAAFATLSRLLLFFGSSKLEGAFGISSRQGVAKARPGYDRYLGDLVAAEDGLRRLLIL
jgi:hypothetical protein